jgi:uncharacterized protein (DUF1810 family)
MVDDRYHLHRFLDAQEHEYARALAEIRGGQKRSHWMWYIFPQYDGLASSATSRYYALKSVGEADAYLRHPILGARLLECVEALCAIDGRTAVQILGFPDDVKLRSCATLFACVSPPGSAFERLLAKYFAGEQDDRTLRLIGAARASV